MNDLRNFKLFTHAGCLDGSAAAILFMHAGGLRKNITLVPAGSVEEYWESSSASKKFVPVLLVDIAPSTDNLAQKLANRTDTFVIDHHASAKRFSELDGFFIDVRNTACGSENFRQWLVYQGFEKFSEPSFQRFTEIIDDHDRWQRKIPFSMEQPKFFSFVGQNEFINRFMNVEERFAEEKDNYWTPFEKELMVLIQKEQERRFRSLLSRFMKITREHHGRKFVVGYSVNGEVNVSELLHMYLEENPDVDVACQINLDLNKVSLRSNDNVNITEYAGRYGGGGHKDAGGHPLPEDIVTHIANLVHK